MRLSFELAAGLAALSSLGLFACGGSEPPPKAPAPVIEAPVVERPRRGPSMSQELGSIDERATMQTFTKLQSQLGQCHRDGLKRVEVLAGDVKFFLRVGQDGKVRWSYLEESTMGDRDTEKCMLGVLGAADWPKPEDGDAEVRKGMGFDGPDARPPSDWSSDKIALVLAKQADEATRCKEGVKGSFKVTAYVVPGAPPSHAAGGHARHGGNGGSAGKEGHVEAAGVAPPNKEGEGKVDCIVSAVKEWHMPSPGSYPAKVSFIL